VSADLRRPSLHRFFGLSNDVGLSDVLSGAVPFDRAVQTTAIPGVSVLAGGPVPSSPAELLDSTQMRALVRALRTKWDFVLLDGPPVLAIADALILSPYGDGILMIVDAETTTRAALEHACEQIEQVGGKVVGGVLNKLDPTRGSYYSPYYGSSYYRLKYREDSGPMRAVGNGATPESVRRKA
jgi:polysaccharide biosynthesis transport protein